MMRTRREVYVAPARQSRASDCARRTWRSAAGGTGGLAGPRFLVARHHEQQEAEAIEVAARVLVVQAAGADQGDAAALGPAHHRPGQVQGARGGGGAREDEA